MAAAGGVLALAEAQARVYGVDEAAGAGSRTRAGRGLAPCRPGGNHRRAVTPLVAGGGGVVRQCVTW